MGFFDADPQRSALLASMAQGMYGASKPSFMPLGFAPGLIGGAQGLQQGQDEYLKRQLEQQKLQSGNIGLQESQMGLQAKQAQLANMQRLLGGGNGAPSTPMGFPATRMDAINQATPQGGTPDQGAANLGTNPPDTSPMGAPTDPLASYFPPGTPPSTLNAARMALGVQDFKTFNDLITKSNEPYTLGRPGAARYSGNTQIASAPTPEQPFNLAPGATRYGADGKAIVTAPEKPALAAIPLPPEVEAQRVRIAAAEAAARADAGGEKWDSPKLIEIDDAQGGTRQITAQQNKKTGQWVTADEKRAPIDASNIRVVTSSLPGGGRVAGQVIRITTAAHDIASELENISQLPSGASAGLFPKAGMMGTPIGALARKVTSQEVQSYKTSSVGISRALAALEAAGLAPPGSLTNQMEGLQLQDGDTELTKMQKMATVRQQASNSIDAILASPLLSKQQREEVTALKSRMEKAIPWTPLDVINLMNSKNPKATLGDFAKSSGLDKTTARPAPQGVDPGLWQHMTPEEQALWK